MAPRSSELNLFTPLPPWQMPWRDFFLSYGAQIIVIAIFVWIPVLHPEILDRPKRDYHAIALDPTPVPVNHEPQSQLPNPVLRAELPPPPAPLPVAAPRAGAKPKGEDGAAPDPKIAAKKL